MHFRFEENGPSILFHDLLFNFRFGNAWIFQEIGNVETFICEFKQRVKNVLTQEWLTTIHTSSRYDLYSLFKVTLTPEMYITDPSFAFFGEYMFV